MGRRTVMTKTFCAIAGIFLCCTGFAQQRESSVMIQHVDWKVEGEKIVITYDLLSEPDVKYDISMTMLNEDDPSIRVTPRAVTGDIGIVEGGGKRKKVSWLYRKDLDYGLEGGKYYFELKARLVEESHPWKYVAIGAGVLAGGVVAFLLAHNGSQDNSGLPGPPDRP